jgi:hypothetical protein
MPRWSLSAVLVALAVAPSAFGQDILDLDDDEHGHYIARERALTPTPGRMTEEAAQAKRLFDGNEWLDAALAMDRIVRGETGDDAGNRQIAQYQLAITLYNLRFYNASLGIFREIAGNAHHNKFNETLLWLARLAIQLPEPADIVELVGRYSREPQEAFSNPQQQNLHWQLSYLWARARYRSGSLEDAATVFAKVDKRSPYFGPAKIWEGATWVRQGRAAPALRAFEQVGAAAKDEDDEESLRATALSELSMARVLYSSAIRGKGPSDASVDGRRLTAAIDHYNRVPVGEYKQDALVEAAWAHYMAGDFSRSLGSLTAAKAPLFGALPRPEADRLEVLLSYATCRYDAASARIAESRTARAPHRKEIADLLQRVRDDDQPGNLLAWARRARADKDVGKPLRAMVAGGRIRRHLDYVATIEHEQALLRKSSASLRDSDVGHYIADELDLQRGIAVATAEDVVLEELEALAKEYRTHDAQLTQMADTIDAKKPGAPRAPGQLAGAFRPASDPDAIQWPFDGEYWKDEMNSYQAVMVSQCK